MTVSHYSAVTSESWPTAIAWIEGGNTTGWFVGTASPHCNSTDFVVLKTESAKVPKCRRQNRNADTNTGLSFCRVTISTANNLRMSYPNFNTSAAVDMFTNYSALEGPEVHPPYSPGPMGPSEGLAAQQTG
jgi:hypothetical protein